MPALPEARSLAWPDGGQKAHMHVILRDERALSSLHAMNVVGASTGACHCQALRQAARRASAFYDAALAPLGLRVSQFGILARLRRDGPRGIQALAADLAMDRTTLGRNVRPLERDGLLRTVADPADGRSRLLSITPRGAALVEAAWPAWTAAQAGFEARYGAAPAAELHAALQRVVAMLQPPEG